MATYDDDDDFYDYGALPEINQQEFLYDQLGFVGVARDQEAHNMFWDLMYNDELGANQREGIHEDLRAYLLAEYGIDFDDVWDWEDFRSWYESA